MSWSARKAANTSISAPEPRWVHSFTGGVSHTRRAEAPKPIAKNQAHEALITLAANPSRSPALWTAIAPPRRPTVSKTAWGFSKETPTVCTIIAPTRVRLFTSVSSSGGEPSVVTPTTMKKRTPMEIRNLSLPGATRSAEAPAAPTRRSAGCHTDSPSRCSPGPWITGPQTLIHYHKALHPDRESGRQPEEHPEE